MIDVSPFLRRTPDSIALLSLLCALPLTGADSVRIKVDSSWNGLGAPSRSTIVIGGDNGKYSASGHRVAAQAVNDLIAVLKEPPVEKPSLENCGINLGWLNANVGPAQRDFIHRKLTARQTSFFRSYFTDVPSIQQAFESAFSGFHTDDYPEMRLSISQYGSEVSLHSRSQHPFMLPWVVEGNHQSTTFNCHISRAIAALLPGKFTNRDRLIISSALRWELTDQMMQRVQHDWDILDTEERVGQDLALIQGQFTLLESEIGCLSSVDVEAACGKRLTWNAELSGKSLPPNMKLGVSLPYDRDRLVGTDQFLAHVKDYVALVLSVPWFTDFMKQHPDTVVELRYVGERSLSPKALSDLAEDMKHHGKNELADRLVRDADKSAFLQIESSAGPWSRWVVFPNREMLLWYFKGESVLQWKATQFDAWDYYGLRSTCAIFEPDGALSR